MSTDSQNAENTPAAFLQRGYLHVSNRMSVQSVSAL